MGLRAVEGAAYGAWCGAAWWLLTGSASGAVAAGAASGVAWWAVRPLVARALRRNAERDAENLRRARRGRWGE
ncbi:hypothetical protein [Streptomyces sulphureus]|uniref:hypothetical protein n=1 Tax=Streptomyces sulphureus TaxID=47758 RepID=UPI000372BCCE|nr:hypothetical protein [Streptomyces sulphureus]